MNKMFKRNHLKFYVSSILYKISLDMLYIFGTSQIYDYLGRGLNFNLTKYIIGWVFFFVIISLIEKIKVEKIRFMIKCIFILTGVSNVSVFGLRNYNYYYFLVVLIFWSELIILCVLLSYSTKFKEKENFQPNRIVFNYKDELLLLVGIAITIYEVLKYGIHVSDFSSLYSARDAFRAQTIPTIDSYLLSWNGTVILPWCFLVSLKRKKYFNALIAVLAAMFMFLINGLKTWVIIYLIVFLFCYLLRSEKKTLDYAINLVQLGLALLIVGSLLYYSYSGSIEVVGLLDRSVILPGEVNYFYLDFFNNHELLYLRESILKSISSSPYSPWSAVQISQTYMQNAFYHNATNGMIGDFYGNFGIFGILSYPFGILGCFYFLNSSLEKFDRTISAVVSFILMWMLINTSFFTWIMTGGFAIYLAILFMYKKIRI